MCSSQYLNVFQILLNYVINKPIILLFLISLLLDFYSLNCEELENNSILLNSTKYLSHKCIHGKWYTYKNNIVFCIKKLWQNSLVTITVKNIKLQ